MKNMLIHGAAVALFAAAMGAAGTASAGSIYPAIPCTDANFGEYTTVQRNGSVYDDEFTYVCGGGPDWLLVSRCWPATGHCIYYM